MENIINVAELLKECPQGMELDCAIWNNVTFGWIDSGSSFPIEIKIKGDKTTVEYLTKFGEWDTNGNSKCVIFPKGKTTWEGFVPPREFKDGDVLFVDCSEGEDMEYQYIFILNNSDFCGKWYSYCHLDGFGCFHSKETYLTDEEYHPRLATEVERQKLFRAMKDNGYRWNTETKALEKLIEPKFKDGDIVTSNNGEYIFMLKKARLYPNDDVYNVYNGTCYFGLAVNSEFLFKKESEWYFNRLATEEEKQKLFDVIKSNGYRWNTETKALEKLIESKFKVGDRVRLKNDKTIITTINYIYHDSYGCDKHHLIFFEEQDNYELVPTKFDINTLVPFESRVLVRDYSYGVWMVSFWGCLLSNEYGFIYDTIRGGYKQCIPYEGNEHLLGTTNDCDSYFKTWE